jgi:hypothetical protein
VATVRPSHPRPTDLSALYGPVVFEQGGEGLTVVLIDGGGVRHYQRSNFLGGAGMTVIILCRGHRAAITVLARFLAVDKAGLLYSTVT